eukprot:1143817-Pelagomonas_calceolata.AAC.5
MTADLPQGCRREETFCAESADLETVGGSEATGAEVLLCFERHHNPLDMSTNSLFGVTAHDEDELLGGRLSPSTFKRNQGNKAARVMSNEDEPPPSPIPTPMPTPSHTHPAHSLHIAAAESRDGGAPAEVAGEGKDGEGEGGGSGLSTPPSALDELYGEGKEAESVRDLVRLLSTGKGLKKADFWTAEAACNCEGGGSREGSEGQAYEGVRPQALSFGAEQEEEAVGVGLLAGAMGGARGSENVIQVQEETAGCRNDQGPPPRPSVPSLPLHRLRDKGGNGAGAAGGGQEGGVDGSEACGANKGGAGDADGGGHREGAGGNSCMADDLSDHNGRKRSVGAAPGAAAAAAGAACSTPPRHRASLSSPLSVYSKLYNNAAAAPDSPPSTSTSQFGDALRSGLWQRGRDASHFYGNTPTLHGVLPHDGEGNASQRGGGSWGGVRRPPAGVSPDVATRPSKLQSQLEKLRAEMQQREDASNVSDSM